MPITRENVNDVLAKAKERLDNLRIDVNKPTKEEDKKIRGFDRFKQEMAELGASRSYEEGQSISESDLSKITNEVGMFLDHLRPQIVQALRGANNINSVEMLICATDYIYAMAMQSLGCPDIPESFGPSVQNHISKMATSINGELSLHSETHANQVFWKQRGKDADEVRDAVSDVMTAAEEGKATPRQVQELMEEYQALHQRQQGHGFWWRAFHRTENRDRTELLSNMESALKTMLGDKVNLLDSSAAFVAGGMIRNNVTKEVAAAFENNSFNKRVGIQELNSADQNEKKIESTNDLRAALEDDLNPKEINDVKQPKINEIKAPHKENAI